MSDFSSNNTPDTATYKGVLLPDGWTTNIPSRAHSFTIYDSTGTYTSDPVDYYKFTVPQGVTQVSVHMGVTLNGSNDIVSYYANLDGTKISGPNGGVEVTSQYTSSFQQGGTLTPGGYTAVYQVTPGDHILEVKTGAYDTSGQPVEHSYSLDIQIAQQTNTQPGTTTTTPPSNTTTTTPHSNTAPSQSYTTPDGYTHVPATSTFPAYSYGPTDRYDGYSIFSSDNLHVTATTAHQVVGFNNVKSADSPIVNLGSNSIGLNFSFIPRITYTNFEAVQYSDKVVFLLNSDHANIARLYSAALGRAPDLAGQAYWEDNYDKSVPASVKDNVYTALAQTTLPINGLSLAGGFTNSAEFKNKYGTLNDTQYVTQLYNNVLGRGPEAAGLTYWLNNMHNGDANGVHYTREMVLVGFAESPENIAKVGHDWLMQIY